ncbi:hypothetical protein BGZ83_005510 [Gryganskiella cystojenkinii]|nr:hypothetical protein BGZ83_005510 [Gryganskiella cystojenkinii]
MLLSKIPAHKIHMGKRILAIFQNEDGVLIRTSDNATHQGDILVGADGAYSAVRLSLYRQLSETGQLPESDAEPLTKGFSCIVGITESLDPERFPELKDPFTHASLMVSEDSTHSVESEAFLLEQFRSSSSSWEADGNIKSLAEFKGLKTPHGTLGSLMESTLSDNISKVYLEDKMFKTWNHGRTVLTGDGAINAMQDAVVLANCIYEMPSNTFENIQAALSDYKTQRYQHVITNYRSSQLNAKIKYGHTLMDRIMRYIVVNYLPKSIQTREVFKTLSYRPQLTFLAQALPRGQGPIQSQVLSKKYMTILEQGKEAKAF